MDKIKGYDYRKLQKLHFAIERYVGDIYDKVEAKEFSCYVKKLGDVKEDVDQYAIDFWADVFDVDIYFINASNGKIYKGITTPKGRLSIIMYWVGGGHYEIIGECIGNTYIKRTFNAKDSIIKILSFLNRS
jgi:hypothetical protein